MSSTHEQAMFSHMLSRTRHARQQFSNRRDVRPEGGLKDWKELDLNETNTIAFKEERNKQLQCDGPSGLELEEQMRAANEDVLTTTRKWRC
jgi:hypothetical protein